METILVTGSIGFIGFHLTQRLLNEGFAIVGIDNINDYYDVSLKLARLEILKQQDKFQFYQLDLSDRQGIKALFNNQPIDVVVNLAAQAGVRYSLENPDAYVDSNLVGFVNILEGCRHNKIEHLVYASSSSVYGVNQKIPFSTKDNVNHPISLYAATKKANELMAHTYSHLYNLPTTGLRFFTVYGPWGRPDMSYFIFTEKILAGKPIPIFNYGKMQRDFTYIDDIVEGIVRVISHLPTASNNTNSSSLAPYALYNIGNNQPVELIDFISAIEKSLGITAKKELLPMQPGDVPITYADVDDLFKAVGFKPSTSLEQGISEFVNWYRDFYQV
jgi:UDP-glucuronate 4-epimerase